MKLRILSFLALLAVSGFALLVDSSNRVATPHSVRQGVKTPATTTTSSTWTPEAPIPPDAAGGAPTGNTEAPCAAMIGGNIYTAFGSDTSGDTNALRIYNVATDTWTLGPSAPTTGRSQGYRGVAKGGKLYCVGGRPDSTTWIFDTATNTWNPGAPIPDLPRAGTSAATYGDSIFMFGGRHSTTGPCSGPAITSADRGGEILRYDIPTNAWFPAGNMANPRSDTTVARVGSLIYIFGGCNGTQYPPDVEIYNPRTETSTPSTATFPGGSRSNATAADPQNGSSANAAHVIHVTGGFNQTGTLITSNNHVIFDVDAQAFTVGTPMPTHCANGQDRAEHETVYGGDRIHALGGACPSGNATAINNVDVLMLSGVDPTAAPTAITAAPCSPSTAYPVCALEALGSSMVYLTGSGFVPAGRVTLSSSQQGTLPDPLADTQGAFTFTYIDTFCNGQNDTITASDGVNSASVTFTCS